MRVQRFFFAIALIVLLASCKKEPKFIGLDNVQVIDLNERELQLQLDYVVYNPNGVKSTLTSSAMNVYFKDELVGHGILVNEMALASKDTIRIPVSCYINLPKLHTYYKDLMQSSTTVFHLKGQNKVKFFMGSQEMAVDDEIIVDTRELVNREIKQNFTRSENFKVKSLGLNRLPTIGTSSFSISIEMLNNLPIDYTIEAMDLNFYGTNKEEIIANWKLEGEIVQKGNTSSSIDIRAEINNLALLKQGKLTWLLTQKAKFKLRGKAMVRVGDFTFSVPIEDQVEIGI